ncbi:conserved hypothetical protein [Theileria orientalis strain Shintoku]|uniref:HIT-type domain-containing protein n=1 Tax=Theileria orientalis strain Shintoku TaxID=869250 RepID=J4D9M3_THEOR|nr:conserved hypothetical protein [Theileria orientalis strain Shintoku]BAM41480.1 conserved hypothetical protein [Theileria orientalis strain Shintoku]|eukprot:XP_009691781.1 conserved hypothetical protein [Theileria orientalis strain Shintoku]
MTVVCNECGAQSPKYRYKCCLLQFCSFDCYKAHSCSSADRPTPSCSFSQGAAKPDAVAEAPSTTKLTDAQLDILKSDSMLKEYLRDEKLKLVLVDIASSEDPMERAQRYIREERFKEFVSYLLTLIERF